MSSYADEIRDAIYDKLAGDDIIGGEFVGKRKLPTFQWQPENLPAIGVYTLRERMVPEGDDNVGPPSFIHDATIGIQILVRAPAANDLDVASDGPVGSIYTKLLTDPAFNRKGPNALFESIVGITRETVFPGNAEAYLAETRLEVTVRFRTDWPPVIPDDFLSVSLSSRPLGASTATLSTTVVYDVPQE